MSRQRLMVYKITKRKLNSMKWTGLVVATICMWNSIVSRIARFRPRAPTTQSLAVMWNTTMPPRPAPLRWHVVGQK